MTEWRYTKNLKKYHLTEGIEDFVKFVNDDSDNIVISPSYRSQEITGISYKRKNLKRYICTSCNTIGDNVNRNIRHQVVYSCPHCEKEGLVGYVDSSYNDLYCEKYIAVGNKVVSESYEVKLIGNTFTAIKKVKDIASLTPGKLTIETNENLYNKEKYIVKNIFKIVEESEDKDFEYILKYKDLDYNKVDNLLRIFTLITNKNIDSSFSEDNKIMRLVRLCKFDYSLFEVIERSQNFSYKDLEEFLLSKNKKLLTYLEKEDAFIAFNLLCEYLNKKPERRRLEDKYYDFSEGFILKALSSGAKALDNLIEEIEEIEVGLINKYSALVENDEQFYINMIHFNASIKDLMSIGLSKEDSIDIVFNFIKENKGVYMNSGYTFYKSSCGLYHNFSFKGSDLFIYNVLQKRVETYKEAGLNITVENMKNKHFNEYVNILKLSKAYNLPEEKVVAFNSFIDEDPLKAYSFIANRRKLTKKELDELKKGGYYED